MTTTAWRPTAAAATSHTPVRPGSPQPGAWRIVAAAMFCIGWGGNQFTPLLIAYRQRLGYSTVDVDVFLGAYVFGLVPGLLVTSALSDRYGRRPVLTGGLLASLAGSATLACGQVGGAGALIVGRLLCGLAIGTAMAVGTAWVNELSTATFDPSAGPGTGARRASIALTLGFAVGPAVAGPLVQWGPWPFVLPYLVQAALTVVVVSAVRSRAIETRFDDGIVPVRRRLRVPSVAHRRFLWVVLPMAPWVFGAAAVAYAIVPQLVDKSVGHWALMFATALTVATLAAGVLIQPLAKRLDSASTARAIVVAMLMMCVGIGGAAATAATGSPWLAMPVAVLLGAAYGTAVVSGLLEIQRITSPDEFAGLSGVYYALAYIGFLFPAALAALSKWVGYTLMLGVLGLVAMGCTVIIASAWSRHVPSTA